MGPPRLRAIVFDLWGTLMTEQRGRFPERARMRFEGVRDVLQRYGIEVEQDQFTQRHLASNRTIGRMQDHGRDVSAEDRARHVIYQFAPHLADRLSHEDIAEFVEGYGGVVRHTPPVLLDGALEALERARHLGLRVGLMSNTGISGGRHLREVFAEHRLLDCFDSLLFSDEHGMSKPNPRFFDRALEELDATTETAAFVGDTPRFDVGPPRRLGWWVVQVGDRDDGDPPAHRRVEGVADIYGALGDLGLIE